MLSKSEIMKIIAKLKKNSLSGKLHIHPVSDWIDIDVLKKIIEENSSDEEIYIKFGEILAESDSCLNNIYFREDCYDYLMANGFEEKEAFELMEVIRKGQYRFEKHQIKSTRLSDEFYEWAKGVKYLPSRAILNDIFDFDE